MTANVYAFTPVSGFMYLFKTFFYLGVFAVIFYLIMKYVFPKMGNFTKLGGHIQILDRRMLEMNVSVHLVQVGSKYFLLGSSSKNLTLLSEISAKDAVTHSQTTPEIPNVGASFAEILAKVRAVLPRKKDEE